jgi:hypothetical protein
MASLSAKQAKFRPSKPNSSLNEISDGTAGTVAYHHDGLSGLMNPLASLLVVL